MVMAMARLMPKKKTYRTALFQIAAMPKLDQPSSIEVSVIVPVHNRSNELKECLHALSVQDYSKDRFEIIICDDGSTENLSDAVEYARNLGIALVYVRQERKGPASARNLGILQAHGSIIAMTDSDTLPNPNWLKNLCAALNESPKAVGVEGMVSSLNDLEFIPLSEGPTNKSGKVYLTCNCAYRREVLFQIGGFDETFPYPAYEDVELAAQVKTIGPILWQPDALVIHPQRALNLKAVLKKLTHWEFVLIMAFRFGYFGWPQYKTKYPRLRAVALSVLALPFSKIRAAAGCMLVFPSASIKLLTFGFMECLGALFFVAPKVLFGNYASKSARGDYLNNRI